ncbi:uncharacterized protein LOC130449818 [Diorhabda sublineata]|uniref:uncharacterized protein LOC130449818 n=1 Tax=Diorhabda sublineata TaxID=1163346 RepID=UPI0024E0DA2A|nr:uncharacterized protein LOC130449818 [Diorhabda sublineata]
MEVLFEIYCLTAKIGELAQKKDIKKLTVIFQKELNLSEIRKAVEIALMQFELNVEIFVSDGMTLKKQNKRRESRDEALYIERGNRSYAELLKAVKEEVHNRNLNNKIKAARMTKAGDLLLTMERNSGGADDIANALKDINGEGKIRKLGGQEPRAVLHVRNIDAVTSKEEIETAVKSLMAGSETDYVSVSNLRPGFRETQIVTVLVDKKTGKKLTDKGNIRIGFVSCTVRQRVNVLTCYKCWGIGHTTWQCSGPDRSKCCKNCGKEGHQKNKCTEKSYCLMCSESGHRLHTMRCPRYRRDITKGDIVGTG